MYRYLSFIFIFISFFLFYNMNSGNASLINTNINRLSTSEFQVGQYYCFFFFASSLSASFSQYFLYFLLISVFVFINLWFNYDYRSVEVWPW